ncbi:hypothetical protein ACFQ2T_05055 [Methylophilus flavus]|uniref:Uncharacterized protein n=1 Tax=Methylophilus flavus TaxID=640084 RepID=A0ABW3PDH2_9PROT
MFNQPQDIQTLAYGRDGNVVLVDWPTAQKLHAENRRFVHKPESLKTFVHPHHANDDGDLGPEAA